jgi:hypothetical protein
LVAAVAVIGAIGKVLRDRIGDLMEQRGEYLVVANVVGRHEGRHDLMGVGVHAKVDLARGSALAVAVLAHLPFPPFAYPVALFLDIY